MQRDHSLMGWDKQTEKHKIKQNEKLRKCVRASPLRRFCVLAFARTLAKCTRNTNKRANALRQFAICLKHNRRFVFRWRCHSDVSVHIWTGDDDDGNDNDDWSAASTSCDSFHFEINKWLWHMENGFKLPTAFANFQKNMLAFDPLEIGLTVLCCSIRLFRRFRHLLEKNCWFLGLIRFWQQDIGIARANVRVARSHMRQFRVFVVGSIAMSINEWMNERTKKRILN